jgi:hypothetical protein
MPTNITPAFDQALLAKLFRQLGSDNDHERTVVIAKINGVLARSNKTWADVPALLLIETLVPKPEKSDTITAAAIYNTIDERHPTVLLDQGDNIGLTLTPNGIFRAVLNRAHRGGGCRTILHRGRPCRFSTLAPLLMAGIGRFPLPLMHRALVIEMDRDDGSGELKRFTGHDPAIESAESNGRLLPKAARQNKPSKSELQAGTRKG